MKVKVVFSLCLLGQSLIAIGQVISISTISAGGGFYEGATRSNSWTVGQLVYQTNQNSTHTLTQGFQQPNSAAFKISGGIISPLGTAIPTVSVGLTGNSTESMMTANDGLFTHNGAKGGNYTITPSKNNDSIVNNGVTTLDILLIRRHILGSVQLNSPYKIIAANVDFASAGVTTLDILKIRRVILGSDTTFPAGLWAFVSSDYVFPDTLNPFPYENYRSYINLSTDQINQDFIGIKMGDVSGDWNPAIPKKSPIGNVQFAIGNYTALPESEIVIPVRVKDFKKVAGYQFTLSWDERVIELVEVNNKMLKGFYGESRTTEGLLTTSWDDDYGSAITLDDEAVLFELKFKVVGTAGSFSPIVIGSEITRSETYNENLDLLSISSNDGMVKVRDGNSIFNYPSSIINFSIQPNPFSNSTKFIFTLPQDETVSISIYDLPGKVVRQFDGAYQSGEHSIEWDGNDESGMILPSGLYQVRMKAGKVAAGKKLLRINQ